MHRNNQFNSSWGPISLLHQTQTRPSKCENHRRFQWNYTVHLNLRETELTLERKRIWMWHLLDDLKSFIDTPRHWLFISRFDIKSSTSQRFRIVKLQIVSLLLFEDMCSLKYTHTILSEAFKHMLSSIAHESVSTQNIRNRCANRKPTVSQIKS